MKTNTIEPLTKTKYTRFLKTIQILVRLKACDVTLQYIEQETANLAQEADVYHEQGFLSDAEYNGAINILDRILARHINGHKEN